MCIYIYIYIERERERYIYIYIYICHASCQGYLLVGSRARQRTLKRTCVRGTGSGFLRKSTGANGRTRFSPNTNITPVLFLQTSPKVSGNLREFTGECNLGIPYSSSLLMFGSIRDT